VPATVDRERLRSPIGAPCDLEIAWDGGHHAFNLKVRALDGFANAEKCAVSHFAFGIVTFNLGWLFRTPPGWNLLASGPLNRPKDGIAPLAGVVETHWLPYPFTMNWQLTRPGTVRFDKDEPVCMVIPLPAGAIESFEPEIRRSRSRPTRGRRGATISCVASREATRRRSRRPVRSTTSSASCRTAAMRRPTT